MEQHVVGGCQGHRLAVCMLAGWGDPMQGDDMRPHRMRFNGRGRKVADRCDFHLLL